MRNFSCGALQQGWKFITEKKLENKKTRTRWRKHTLVQENTHSFKKKSTHTRKKTSPKITRSRTRKRPRKIEKNFFSWSFSWSRVCFLERVLFFLTECVRVFLNECVLSCFLTFFFSFVNCLPRLLFPSFHTSTCQPALVTVSC